jgi:hypothetical protein
VILRERRELAVQCIPVPVFAGCIAAARILCAGRPTQLEQRPGTPAGLRRVNFRGVKRKMSNYSPRPRERQRTRLLEVRKDIRIVR